jgi:hypothetical protein
MLTKNSWIAGTLVCFATASGLLLVSCGSNKGASQPDPVVRKIDPEGKKTEKPPVDVTTPSTIKLEELCREVY